MIRYFAVFVVTCYMKLFHCHKVYGVKHLPKKGGGIIAANHCSFLDPPIVGISYPYEVHFLGRASLFSSPFFAWLIKKLNAHPVAAGKGNLATIRKCLELLNQKKTVVIFPEGKRSKTGQLQKGQPGVAMLVMRTNSKVIPTYIHGSYEVWNSSRKYPTLTGKTACIFGSPIDFSHIDVTDKRKAEEEVVTTIMDKIALLRDWYHAGHLGSPP